VNKLQPLILAAMLTGCGTFNYQSYEGQQQQWPTSLDSFAHEVNGMKIYHGYPPKPYTILGKAFGVDISAERMVSMAKVRGADAMILQSQDQVQGQPIHIAEETHINYQSSAFGTLTPGPIASYNDTTHGNATIVTSPAYDIPVVHNSVVLVFIKFLP